MPFDNVDEFFLDSGEIDNAKFANLESDEALLCFVSVSHRSTL